MTREQTGWTNGLVGKTPRQPVVPMSDTAADALAFQYTQPFEKLQETLDAAGATAVVIPLGPSNPGRLSLSLLMAQEADSSDIAYVDLYAASNSGFFASTGDQHGGVILEYLGRGTFAADGADVIDDIGVSNSPNPYFWPETALFTSADRAEARSKAAIEPVTGRAPATIEVTDPGECSGIVAIVSKPDAGGVAAAMLVWRHWQ